MSDVFGRLLSVIDINLLTSGFRRKYMGQLEVYKEFFLRNVELYKHRKSLSFMEKIAPGSKKERDDTDKRVISQLEDYVDLLTDIYEKCAYFIPDEDNADISADTEYLRTQLDEMKGNTDDDEVLEWLLDGEAANNSLLKGCFEGEKAVIDSLTNLHHFIVGIKNADFRDLKDWQKSKLIQDRCAEKVLEQKFEGVDCIDCLNKALNSIGEDTWQKMDKISQKLIVSAEILLERIPSNSDFDYAAVCLTATKALEIELGKRYFSDYIKYSIDQNIKNLTSGLIKDGVCTRTEAEFSFEYLEGITGFAVNEEGELEVIPKFSGDNMVFLDYAFKELTKTSSKQHSRTMIMNQVFASNVIKTNFRDAAALGDRLSYSEAKDCMDYLIDDQRAFGVILEQFR
ncbi:MAG: hypothetical protein J6P45_03520 [Lachnospiraceae bacterium]|nr:hypothetical protein [Lachnospiraceae bacterium]